MSFHNIAIGLGSFFMFIVFFATVLAISPKVERRRRKSMSNGS